MITRAVRKELQDLVDEIGVSPISPQREELQSYILDDASLEYVEQKFPGLIRIETCRRTRAVLTLKLKPSSAKQTITYHLPEDEKGDATLQIEATRARMITENYPDLWAYARHRACEAMLALRNGHKEHVRVSARRRASKKLDQQQTPKADA
jgi:hypothetical protein